MTDRFERLNPDYANEHSLNPDQLTHDRFTDLNPRTSENSPNARYIRAMAKADFQRAIFFMIVAVIMCPFFFYYAVVIPKQRNIMLADLKWTKAQDVPKLAGTDKLCKADFYTENTESAPNGVALEFLQKESYVESRRSRTKYWATLAITPELLKLSSPDKKIHVYVRTKDLDDRYAETYYAGAGADMDVSTYPAEWSKLIAAEPTNNYKLSGLPAMHKITVIGQVKKEGDRLYLVPFTFKNARSGVIASSATHEQLEDFLNRSLR